MFIVIVSSMLKAPVYSCLDHDKAQLRVLQVSKFTIFSHLVASLLQSSYLQCYGHICQLSVIYNIPLPTYFSVKASHE